MEYDLKWVEEPEAGAAEEAREADLLAVMEDVNEFLKVEFELSGSLKKMRDAELSLSRLSPMSKTLFDSKASLVFRCK